MVNETKLQRKGEFSCLNKAAENCGALFVAGLFVTLLVIIVAIFNMGSDINSIISTLLGVCIVLEIALVLIWLVLSMRGSYRYEVYENEFVVISPRGEKEFFYYNDIQSVDYQPLKQGKRKGYLVTITMGIRSTRYKMLFGHHAENTETSDTPFYYLEVNAGLREPVTEDLEEKTRILEQFEKMSHAQSSSKKKKSEREAQFWKELDAEKAELAAKAAEIAAAENESDKQPEESGEK